MKKSYIALLITLIAYLSLIYSATVSDSYSILYITISCIVFITGGLITNFYLQKEK